MVASFRLGVVVSAIAGCTFSARPQVERRLEHDLATLFGITAEVRCPPYVVTEPGDTVTCETTEAGESYRVRLKIDDQNHWVISLTSSDSVLFPVSLLEERSGLRLACPSPNKHYLRVRTAEPGHCKIIGSGDYLRIQLLDSEAETWLRSRVTHPYDGSPRGPDCEPSSDRNDRCTTELG